MTIRLLHGVLFGSVVSLLGILTTDAAGTADLAIAQKDDDFAVQGEYVTANPALPARAMQVIARGDGEFDLVIYEGGLPGAGAKANPRRIESDIDVVEDLIDSMELTRVERASPTLGRDAPAGATILFDGRQATAEQNWVGAKVSEEGWLMEGTQTKATFGDYQLHAEFRTPWSPLKQGQQRGNSGIYHQGRYETQVLDSFGLQGLDNETGSIYTVSAPSINACFPPMSWQTYDVDFTAARYNDAGIKIANARMTVRLNGIMVQNDVEVPTATRGSILEEGVAPGPIYLQNHGDPVRFRNIWLLPRDATREAARPLIAGFERFAGTDSTSIADAGNVLMHGLACNACHSSLNASLPSISLAMVPDQKGPNLSEVAGRIRHDALLAMIADPHLTKPNTTMPDPWPGLDSQTRTARAAKIASYLILEGKGTLADRAVRSDIIDRGKALYHSVGCVACHAAIEGTGTPKSTSVPLGELHLKYTVPSLAAFLRNCNEVRPGIRMPAFVGEASDAVAIAAYLTRQVCRSDEPQQFTRKVYRGDWRKLPNFDELDVVQTDRVSELKIDDLPMRNKFGVVFEANLSIESDGIYELILRCDDGARVRIGQGDDANELADDGIHPANERRAEFELKAGIVPIRVEYFDGGGQIELSLDMIDPQLGRADIANWIVDPNANATTLDFVPSGFKADPSWVAEGRQLFATSGCIACHEFKSSQSGPPNAPPLDQWTPGKGCLADDVQSPAVDYRLGSSQIAAIEVALQSAPTPRRSAPALNSKADSNAAPSIEDASNHVHLALVSLNCYACHVRDSIGGPEPSRDAYFTTTIPEMGWEGRLPPSLDGVADKLNDDYLTSVLADGANARDYMVTRMPAFHDEKLRPLLNALIRLDRRDEMEPTVTELSDDQVLINGRKLCGDEGLSCIKCHSFGGDKGGGLGAIDMLMMPERLRPSWFQRYLQDPTQYRPGTRMPNSFVDGRSAIVDINDGSPPLQIDAMWKYLSLGDQAKEPLGLNQAAIVLKADERPRIYRNFFTEASSRGIGVAYPGDRNLLWDAERMSLLRVWKNEFVDASLHWVGRGQGCQKPQGDAIVSIDAFMPIAKLDSLDSPWPTQSARELGYRFDGYQLTRTGTPIFGYRIGNHRISDTTVPMPDGLKRALEVKSDEDLFAQFAVGKIEPMGSDRFRINDQYTVEIDGIALEIISLDGKDCLRGRIPSGRSLITQIIRW